jgi:hypothetical protein
LNTRFHRIMGAVLAVAALTAGPAHAGGGGIGGGGISIEGVSGLEKSLTRTYTCKMRGYGGPLHGWPYPVTSGVQTINGGFNMNTNYSLLGPPFNTCAGVPVGTGTPAIGVDGWSNLTGVFAAACLNNLTGSQYGEGAISGPGFYYDDFGASFTWAGNSFTVQGQSGDGKLTMTGSGRQLFPDCGHGFEWEIESVIKIAS